MSLLTLHKHNLLNTTPPTIRRKTFRTLEENAIDAIQKHIKKNFHLTSSGHTTSDNTQPKPTALSCVLALEVFQTNCSLIQRHTSLVEETLLFASGTDN